MAFRDYAVLAPACKTHTTWTIRNKLEKLEIKVEAVFDTPFMIQTHAESMKTIVGAL